MASTPVSRFMVLKDLFTDGQRELSKTEKAKYFYHFLMLEVALIENHHSVRYARRHRKYLQEHLDIYNLREQLSKL